MSGFGTNPLVQLKGLLASPGMVIGTVLTNHADGTSTVELPGGEQRRVRAPVAVSVGNRAFVRDGAIEGTAPTLTGSSSAVG